MSKKTAASTKPAVTWRHLTAGHGGTFWALIGPIATSKAAIKDLGGYPIYINDRQTWVIAQDAAGNVLAASSIAPSEKKDGSMWIDYAFVAPEARGMGLWTEMLEARLEIAVSKGAKAVKCCTATLARPLEASGFKTKSQRGSWSYMEKSL
jgi:GNAT superfamily N-acetyltransferase